MDIWNKEKRSAVMAKIRSKDTKPELLVCRYLWHRGYRYRKNVRGCFWHGHEADSHIPHSNSDFWRQKIERNKQRDEQNKEKLKQMGWHVMTIWECQLKPAVREQTLFEVEYWINHAYLERFKPKPAKPYETIESFSGMAAEEKVEYGNSEPHK